VVVWGGTGPGPPDAIFGLVEAHKKDPRPNKVSVVIGAYHDGQGKPWVLPTVRKVRMYALHNMRGLLRLKGQPLSAHGPLEEYSTIPILYCVWISSKLVVSYSIRNLQSSVYNGILFSGQWGTRQRGSGRAKTKVSPHPLGPYKLCHSSFAFLTEGCW
jgi:hypothetical protein